MSEAEFSEDPRSPASADDDALDFAKAAARIASDQRCEDVVIIDLRGASGYTDFFVIGTGTSSRQMHAVLDHIKQHARTVDRSPFRVSDTRADNWVLADYVDVVIHVFDSAHREYYDLEGLCDEAPRIEVPTESVEADSRDAS